MKRFGGFVTLLFVLSIFAAVDSYAQPRGMRWRGSGGWGPGMPYSKMYDPKTVETISGEVMKVDAITPRKGCLMACI